MKRRICAVLAAILFLSTPMSAKAEVYWPEGPSINTQSAIVIEVNSGAVLYEKNSDQVSYPASITKILTTLLALENCELDEIVTFSDDAINLNQGNTSHIARDYGEQMTMKECLYAVMLESANECAYAVAEHVGQKLGGNYQTFIDLMNERAKEIGCKNSNFVTASGLEDANHYSCASDLVLITQEALSNGFIREVCGTAKHTVPATNMSAPRKLENSNVFLYGKTFDIGGVEIKVDKYKGVIGGKTGSLALDYATLSTVLEYDGMEVYCVILGSTLYDRFSDMKEVMDFAKKCISKYVVFEKGNEFDKVKLKGGAINKVMAVAAQEGFVNLPEGASETLVSTKCVYTDDLYAPITKGQKIGVAELYIADDLVSKVDLVAKEDIEEGWFLSPLGISNFQTILIGVVLAVLLGCALTILIIRVNKKRKIAQLRKRKLEEEARKQLEREEDLRRRNWHF